MNYEHKYKEALERAKSFELPEYKNIMESVFPELKEGDSEKIRKALIRFHKSTIDIDGIKGNEIVAWLEKQGESNPYSGVSFEYNGNIWGMCARDNGVDIGLNGELIQHVSIKKQAEQKSFNYENANIQQKDFASKVDVPRYSIGDILCDKSCTTLDKDAQPNFKIVDIRNGIYICDKGSFPISQQNEYELVAEQPKEATCTHEVETGNGNIKALVTEKVQLPEFKVGDWVVNDISKDIFLIKSFNNGYCTLEDVKGEIYTPCLSPNDDFHLWTIKDAKNGDVLVDEYINVIGIFDGIEGTRWHSKFYYSNITKEFYGIECGSFHQKEFAKPATKEQRDLLFQKIKDAGYEWDEEKKELRKIEQKPKWTEEDENFFANICAIIDVDRNFMESAKRRCKDWLKSLKQRIKKQQ